MWHSGKLKRLNGFLGSKVPYHELYFHPLLPRNRKCVAQCDALIFLMSVIYCIRRVKRCRPSGRRQAASQPPQPARRDAEMFVSWPRLLTARRLHPWVGGKRTKYVVCEMAQNPLEVSMEVPITSIKLLVSASTLSLFSPHTGSPNRVTKVLYH